MTILSPEEKEVVKRAIPSGANKIHAVAVGRLYVAYPNPQTWTFSGISGAVALVNDQVGHTFWLKVVDIAPSGKGVIWDQEIYENFSYNQDRVYFFSFELEECYAGFSFVDEKQAKKFAQKMEKREKSASKETKLNAFKAPGQVQVNGTTQSHKHRVFGSLLGLGSSKPHASPQPSPALTSAQTVQASPPRKKGLSLDEVDPTWRPILQDLLSSGFTEEDLETQADFIRDYIEKELAKKKPPPARSTPPPPPPASARGEPPPPPSVRQSVGSTSSTSKPQEPARSRFFVPPPLTDAGKRLHEIEEPPKSSRHDTITSHEPALPQRPPKIPHEEISNPKRVVPPAPTSVPSAPTLPSRGPAPKPPPPRKQAQTQSQTPNHHPVHLVPPVTAAPPPLPPKELLSEPPQPPQRNVSAPIQTSNSRPSTSRRPVPPTANLKHPPVAPPLPPSNSGTKLPPVTPNLPTTSVPPLPPPLPSVSSHPPPPPPPPDLFSPPQPPPSLPNHQSIPSAPPPPAPSLPDRNSIGAPPPPPPPPPLPTGIVAGADRADVMASIRQSGGVGGLKKVDASLKRDRSAAAMPGSSDQAGVSSSAGADSSGAGAADAGLAGALANALAARKKRVGGSDDEDDGDEW